MKKTSAFFCLFSIVFCFNGNSIGIFDKCKVQEVLLTDGGFQAKVQFSGGYLIVGFKDQKSFINCTQNVLEKLHEKEDKDDLLNYLTKFFGYHLNKFLKTRMDDDDLAMKFSPYFNEFLEKLKYVEVEVSDLQANFLKQITEKVSDLQVKSLDKVTAGGADLQPNSLDKVTVGGADLQPNSLEQTTSVPSQKQQATAQSQQTISQEQQATTQSQQTISQEQQAIDSKSQKTEPKFSEICTFLSYFKANFDEFGNPLLDDEKFSIRQFYIEKAINRTKEKAEFTSKNLFEIPMIWSVGQQVPDRVVSDFDRRVFGILENFKNQKKAKIDLILEERRKRKEQQLQNQSANAICSLAARKVLEMAEKESKTDLNDKTEEQHGEVAL